MSRGEVASRYLRRSEQGAASQVRAWQAVDARLGSLRRATALWLWVAVVLHRPARTLEVLPPVRAEPSERSSRPSFTSVLS